MVCIVREQQCILVVLACIWSTGLVDSLERGRLLWKHELRGQIDFLSGYIFNPPDSIFLSIISTPQKLSILIYRPLALVHY